MIDTLRQDLRYAARSLRRTPGFTVAAVLTLALGIGASVTIFTVVHAALFKPLPYPDGDRLFVLGPERLAGAQTGQLFLFVRDRVQSFEAVAAQRGGTGWNVAISRGSGGPEPIRYAPALRVSDGYVDAHGVAPLLGRGFTRAEDQPGGANVVMISEGLWREAFDGRPDALGRIVELGGVPHTLVGVMPGTFRSIPGADVWTPLRTNRNDNTGNYQIIARLRRDVAPAAAAAELGALRADIQREFPRISAARVGATTWVPLRRFLGGNVREPLLMLLGAVAFLLVIACVNIAGLQLTRALSRWREVATRAAIGGSRIRLARQALVESMLLAALGAAGGLAIAAAGTQRLVGLVSQQTAQQMLSGETTGIDWAVLAFTAAVTIASGLLFGVVPSLVWSPVDLRRALSEGVTTTSSGRALWIRRSLAGAEMALACILLVGGGLLVRTLMNLNRSDLGFNPAGVTLARMSLQGAIDSAAFDSFVTNALDRARQIPGVVAAAAGSGVPVERASNLPLNAPAGSLIADTRAVDWRYVTADYFNLFEIPVLAGRAFDDRDRSAGGPVAIVNEAFARAYFGRVDVVGETIGLVAAFKDLPRQIVGVVGDVKARTGTNWTGGLTALGSGSAPMMYVPAGPAALPPAQAAFRAVDITLSVRSTRPPGEVERDLRNAMSGVDARAAGMAFESMDAVIARDLDIPRLVTNVLGTFAALAVALAAIGLYGLMAYAASRRRREVGIRMAFGATTARVLRQFLREGVIVASVGLALGAAGATAVTSVITGLLFDVTPLDVSTYAAVAAALLATAVLASVVPALGAARTNPVTALRSD